jgi:SAM-dependent methyltransferase
MQDHAKRAAQEIPGARFVSLAGHSRIPLFTRQMTCYCPTSSRFSAQRWRRSQGRARFLRPNLVLPRGHTTPSLSRESNRREVTVMSGIAGGSATRWGPLFGARAAVWAETWEGPAGWGTPVYEHVLDRTDICAGARVLDCGCGAGRFARMAADRGASVAGIDASEELVAIAAGRVPEGEFRVGDIEALPWADGWFDVVAGFSAFQFAGDKVRALREARRVSRGPVAVVIPTRVPESGITSVFKPVFPLFAPDALETMKGSGMFALSEPGKLEDVFARTGLAPYEDEEIECPIVFADAEAAERAFLGAGPTQLAIANSGEAAVAEAVQPVLEPFTEPDGRVVLPAWYRAVLAQG